jgi:hypothetical protein
MCTASWLTSPAPAARLHLLFNRDELGRRAAASPPRVAESAAGVRYLAPVDGASGGTWIAAAETGLLLCLLNRNATRPLPTAPRSRGALIPGLVDGGGPRGAMAAFEALDLADLAPFTLVAMAPGGEPALLRAWDGSRVTSAVLPVEAGLLCSSSLGDARADAERRPVWERWRARPPASVDGLRAVHRDHGAAPSAWSVCMHRDDARTVSFCEVEVGPEEIEMRYRGDSPCTAAPTHRVAIARSA